MATDLLPRFILDNYEVAERHHACAVLSVDFPDEWRDIQDVLTGFVLKGSYLVPGGNKSKVAIAIDAAFNSRGWRKKKFEIAVKVDGATKFSPTHEVDMFKNRVAVETEWNNKDPFYDRDLTTFRLLHEYNVASVGIVITRADELQALMNSLGRGSSYGQSTTHWSKLSPRLENRVAGGCPVLGFGIKRSLYDATV